MTGGLTSRRKRAEGAEDISDGCSVEDALTSADNAADPPTGIRPTQNQPAKSTFRAWIHLSLLALLIAFTFSNTLENGLYLDDAFRVQSNPGIMKFWPPWRHFFDNRTNASLPQLAEFRPIVPLSLSIDVAVSRLLGVDRLATHHVMNMVFHFVNCLLLYFLFRELFLYRAGPITRRWRPPDVAFVAVAFYALHPVAGVTINYIGARNVQLMFLFLLGSLLTYIRMRRKGDSIAGWALSLSLLALSISSKQNSAVAPALILAFEFFLAKKSLLSWRTWVRPLPFAAVIASFLAWSSFVIDKVQIRPGEVGEPLMYTATQLRLHVFYYLRNVFWPFRMRMLPDVGESTSLLEPAVIVGLLFLATTVALAFVLRRRAPIVSWCIAAYWILFAPSSLIAFRPMSYFATDYRQYPSLAFFFVVFALALSRIPLRSLAVGSALAFATYFGVAAFSMNRIWRSEESVWGHSVRHGGRSIAEMNYGLAVQPRDRALAEKHYKEALRKAPGNTYAMINLGLVYLRSGRIDEGIETVQKGVANAPTWALTHHWLAFAYDLAGRKAEARAERRVAADLDHRNVAYQYDAGLDLQHDGELDASLTYFERVTTHHPGYKEALFLEGYALQQTGRWKEAEDRYRQFLKSQPQHHRAWFNLAHGLMTEGRHREAIPAFEQVVALDMGLVRSSHWWLAQCYEALEEPLAAANHRAIYDSLAD